MHTVYELLRYFPFWAVPLALIFGDVGFFFRRRTSVFQFAFFGASALMFLLTVLWFLQRGDIHSDKWVNTLLGR